MKKNIVRVILILLMVAIIGLYIYDLVVMQSKPTDHLFRTLSIVFICLAGIVRTFSGGNRRSLNFYDGLYPEILKDAFADQPFWRKKLLCAVRLYNEEKYDKAAKYLTDLKDRCKYKQDYYAVYLFAALNFTDMQLYDLAESAYGAMVRAEIADSRIYSNLGHVQMSAGEYKKALRNYQYALDFDRDNHFAYNNIAQAHFKMYELDEAIPYAMKALEIKPQMHQASSLLAIIYALKADKDNSEKYFHIAINSGRDPKELKEAIDFFRSAQHTMDDDKTTIES